MFLKLTSEKLFVFDTFDFDEFTRLNDWYLHTSTLELLYLVMDGIFTDIEMLICSWLNSSFLGIDLIVFKLCGRSKDFKLTLDRTLAPRPFVTGFSSSRNFGDFCCTAA